MSDEARKFVTPIFRGGRFEAKVLPLDPNVLGDLVAYRDLVVELAAHLLKMREPKRQRAPKGFDDSFTLAIRQLHPGSVETEIVRVVPASTKPAQLLLENEDVFVQARDLVEECLARAAKREALPPNFPRQLAHRFNRFGRGLRDGETVELRSAGRESGPTYDREVRRWIILRFEDSYEDRFDQVFVADGGEVARGLVVLRTDDAARRRLEAQVVADDADENVRRVLQAAPTKSRVRVLGVAQYARDGALERILRVEGVRDPDDEAPERTPLTERFADILALEDGWLEGEGKSFEPEALDALHDSLAISMRGNRIPLPYVYPTRDGEIRLEWTLGPWEVSAVADLTEGSAYTDAIRSDDATHQSLEFTWRSPGGFGELVRFVERLCASRDTDADE